MPKKKPLTGNPDVHKELKGFDIKINEFGEIITSYNIDKINSFLDKEVDDKKLREKNEKENPMPKEEDEEDNNEDKLF